MQQLVAVEVLCFVSANFEGVCSGQTAFVQFSVRINLLLRLLSCARGGVRWADENEGVKMNDLVSWQGEKLGVLTWPRV